jgi:hypothetical protein
MLTEKDFLQLKAKGISPETILLQLDQFRAGFPYIGLLRPATTGDGLTSFSPKEKEHLRNYFTNHARDAKILKFVPASGAATRMFKHLFELLSCWHDEAEMKKILGDSGFNSVGFFLDNLPHFAFYGDLKAVLRRDGLDPEELRATKDYKTIIEYVLHEKGLNYANLPKALLAFHRYGEDYRVAAEEHLVEAANYSVDGNKNAAIHFTVSPEHIRNFDERIGKVKGSYEKRLVITYDIGHSIQKASTDTLAVDEANNPFRNPDGSLLFRPAGHGALLENLNELDAEIVFIKNIDNIVPDHLRETTYEYKQIIGGYLLEMRSLIHDFLRKADSGILSEKEVSSMAELATRKFNLLVPKAIAASDNNTLRKFLVEKLNRPLRVCGMVKNAGEPGGGPFWVENKDGEASLQIVESSQMNLKDQSQLQVFCSSTHFNPVDLVCCIRDFKGIPFNLHDFVDTSTGFISLKSSGGKNLKAMELPGLWNGSMAGWITVFVEVPLLTFNPVKTVNDLLRNEHQPASDANA